MSKSWKGDADNCTVGLAALVGQGIHKTDQQRTALRQVLAQYNSELVEDHSTVDGRLMADVDGRKLREESLLEVLLACGIRAQTIQFRYRLNGLGLAKAQRYWALFHL